MAGIFDLSDRVAVITGGNGGLGLGMAQALADAGCTVSIWGRNKSKTEDAGAQIAARGARVQTLVCDVADEEAVKTAFANTLSELGRVDGMFANAGVSAKNTDRFIDRSLDDWRALFSVNLEGVVNCMRVAAAHMVERAKAGDPFGRLVATSSVAALEGAIYNEHYGASKGAISALVRALAVEFARYGVTANAILPGYCESEMTERLFSNTKFVNNVLPRIPVRRFGRPDDFAGIAIYLMSGASGYHTGQELVIDGGYTVF